jgi:hypothetical protein
MAREGQAPKIFGKKNSLNVPYLSVAASVIPPLLSYASTGKSVGAKNVLGPNLENLISGLRYIATAIDNMCCRFVGSYLCNIPPLSPYCSDTRNAKCYPAKGDLPTATLSCVVWACMVYFVQFPISYIEFSDNSHLQRLRSLYSPQSSLVSCIDLLGALCIVVGGAGSASSYVFRVAFVRSRCVWRVESKNSEYSKCGCNEWYCSFP